MNCAISGLRIYTDSTGNLPRQREATIQPLIKGIQADYIPARWSGVDTSGIRVVGKCVLILMDECSPVSSGAAGMALMKESGVAAASVVPMPGVRLPDDVIERMTMGAETGVLVAVAAGAFLLNEDGTAWSGYKPRPGDRVYIEKYAGKLIRGRDGRNYRLMDYQSIGATYDEEQD